MFHCIALCASLYSQLPLSALEHLVALSAMRHTSAALGGKNVLLSRYLVTGAQCCGAVVLCTNFREAVMIRIKAVHQCTMLTFGAPAVRACGTQVQATVHFIWHGCKPQTKACAYERKFALRHAFGTGALLDSTDALSTPCLSQMVFLLFPDLQDLYASMPLCHKAIMVDLATLCASWRVGERCTRVCCPQPAAAAQCLLLCPPRVI